MTMLDLEPVQVRALDRLACFTCGSRMEAGTDTLSCGGCGTTYPVDDHGIIRALSAAPHRTNLAVRSGQWSWVASIYDALWRTRALSILTGEHFPVDREIDIVSDSIGLQQGRIFLDSACGNAFYARNIARRLVAGGQEGIVFAVDISLPMLRKARALARKEGVADRIIFIHGDAGRLPFADGTFHGIMCGGSLNEFVSPGDVLREMRRVLDPRSGSFSLMFQIRSQAAMRALGQKILGGMLGLQIFGLKDSVEKVRTYFDPEIRFFGGMILMLRCRSRVQVVVDDAEPPLTAVLAA